MCLCLCLCLCVRGCVRGTCSHAPISVVAGGERKQNQGTMKERWYQRSILGFFLSPFFFFFLFLLFPSSFLILHLA